MGGALVLLLNLLMGLAFLAVAAGTRDRFSQLVAVGAAASFVPQAFANLAMTTGLMPVTGIPLPLISQGGSSVLSSFVLLGMVLCVAKSRRDHEPFRDGVGRLADPFGAREAAEPVRDAAV